MTFPAAADADGQCSRSPGCIAANRRQQTRDHLVAASDFDLFTARSTLDEFKETVLCLAYADGNQVGLPFRGPIFDRRCPSRETAPAPTRVALPLFAAARLTNAREHCDFYFDTSIPAT